MKTKSYAYKHVDGAVKITTARSLEQLKAKAFVDNSFEPKELPRLPTEDERLDPTTLKFVAVVKPYRALRREAYRREADPLLGEALYEWQFQGIELAVTAWAQKQAEIRSRFPKPTTKEIVTK